MGQMITLVCPEGATGGPISHGTQTFYPFRLNHLSDNSRDGGGPWAIIVPITIYHNFLPGGFYVYEGTK